MPDLFLNTNKIALATAASALAFPPVLVALVTDWNAPTGGGVIPMFDIEMKASEAAELTVTTLYGVSLQPEAVAVTTVASVTNATNTIEATGHGLLKGQGPFQFTGDDLPVGIVAGTDYWAAVITDGNNFKVAISLVDAIAGTVVALSDDGTGTMTFVGATASEILYCGVGLLGYAADGAITLSTVLGYSTRIDHRAPFVAYAISATIDAGDITITVTPVRDK